MLLFNKKRHQKKFLEQINEHQKIIIRICRIYTFTKEDYEDLFQEILTNAWQSFNRFREQSKFSTWLYRLSLNVALTHQRKWKQKIENSENLNPNQFRETYNSFEETDLLQRITEHLTETEKAFLILQIEGYKYDEIAEIMGVSTSNTGVKLSRIKEKLKRLLKSDNLNI